MECILSSELERTCRGKGGDRIFSAFFSYEKNAIHFKSFSLCFLQASFGGLVLFTVRTFIGSIFFWYFSCSIKNRKTREKWQKDKCIVYSAFNISLYNFMHYLATALWE